MPRNPTQREVLPIKCFHCSNTFSTVSGLCQHLRRAGVKPAAEQARVFQFQICAHCQLPYPSLGRHTKCKSSSQQSQSTDASPEPTPPASPVSQTSQTNHSTPSPSPIRIAPSPAGSPVQANQPVHDPSNKEALEFLARINLPPQPQPPAAPSPPQQRSPTRCAASHCTARIRSRNLLFPLHCDRHPVCQSHFQQQVTCRECEEEQRSRQASRQSNRSAPVRSAALRNQLVDNGLHRALSASLQRSDPMEISSSSADEQKSNSRSSSSNSSRNRKARKRRSSSPSQARAQQAGGCSHSASSLCTSSCKASSSSSSSSFFASDPSSSSSSSSSSEAAADQTPPTTEEEQAVADALKIPTPQQIAQHAPTYAKVPHKSELQFINLFRKPAQAVIRAHAHNSSPELVQSVVRLLEHVSRTLVVPSVSRSSGGPGSIRKQFRAEQVRQQASSESIAPAVPDIRPIVRPDPPADVMTHKIKKAMALTAAGHISRAAKSLTQAPVPILADPAETIPKLQALHPQGPSPADLPQPPADSPDIVIASKSKEFRRLMRRAANGAAAGPSGLTGEMIRVLSRDDICSEAIAIIVEHICNGTLDARLKPYLLASRLVPLGKPTGGVRPIAVGQVLYKLAASYARSLSKNAIPDLLEPFGQFASSLGG